jgi:hypothetical protein
MARALDEGRRNITARNALVSGKDGPMADESAHAPRQLTLAGPVSRPPNRTAANASFLSQLIAERQHLAPQRARRRAGLAEAVHAYSSGKAMAVRRLPQGYRKSLLV